MDSLRGMGMRLVLGARVLEVSNTEIAYRQVLSRDGACFTAMAGALQGWRVFYRAGEGG